VQASLARLSITSWDYLKIDRKKKKKRWWRRRKRRVPLRTLRRGSRWISRWEYK
jgi:hypothetical protein